MHPVVLNWNWRHQYKLTGFNKHRSLNMKIDIWQGVGGWVCIYTYIYVLALPTVRAQSCDIPVAVRYCHPDICF